MSAADALGLKLDEAKAAAPLPLRTRLSIRLARARRWEFWPAWLFYVPVVAWILWLGLRGRHFTAFTAANPVIPAGGVCGERKAPILTELTQREPALVAEFICLTPSPDWAGQALAAVPRLGGFPIVLKPDVGQRGRGVAVVRSEGELRAYLREAAGAVLVQRYIGGEEFGVFVYRDPRDGRARVYSITHKCFPSVTGDGRSTLAALILADARARLIAPLLWQRFAPRLDEVLADGQSLKLVEIGAHCRGSLFLDASALATPALLARMQQLFDALPGYGIGRLDLRCPSAAALQAGEGLQILEINGVTAEAAHIYHPGTPLRAGYASMFRQWRLAFEIGHMYLRRGARSVPPLALLQLWRRDLREGGRWF